MKSESEITWIRVKNNVGQATRVSDWHALIPGQGSLDVPPGCACGMALSGSRQMIAHSGIRTIDGVKHAECIELVRQYLYTIDPTPGPLREEEPDIELAAPGGQVD